MGISQYHPQLNMSELGHDTFLTEIQAQPERIAALLDRPAADFNWFSGLTPTRYLGIGEGSSFNLLQMAQPFVQALTGKPLGVYTPSMWACEKQQGHQQQDTSGVLLVSQSAGTASLIQACEQNPFPKDHTTLVTNTVTGPMSQCAETVFDVGAGLECSIPASKSVTTSLLSLILWACYTSKDPEAVAKTLEPLKALPGQLDNWIRTAAPAMTQLAKTLKGRDEWVFLSQDIPYLALNETRLKFIEILRCQVHVDEMEGFRHGHKALLNRMDDGKMAAIYIVPATDPQHTFYRDLESHFLDRDDQPFVKNPMAILLLPENAPKPPQSTLKLLQPVIVDLPPFTGAANDLFLTLATIQLLAYAVAVENNVPLNAAFLSKFLST